MEELRRAAREALEKSTVAAIPDAALSNIAIPFDLNHLWRELLSHTGSDTSKDLEDLLLAQALLRTQARKSLSDVDRSAINKAYGWASKLALPSPVFGESIDESSLEQRDESRRRSTLAISVISSLFALLPFKDAERVQDVIIALASYSAKEDAWTTPEAHTTATALLDDFVNDSERSTFWKTVEYALRDRIRPLFSRTKNPAITDSGRKNFHPVPLPRFDQSIFDSETRPWKTDAAYITTVFSWVVKQYQTTDRTYLEAHFPFLIPPILTLIDDDSLPFKRTGCTLLTQLLIPIRESNSDILRRTNLSSVFEDAIRPCFHSLPTITPEEDSMTLLSAAYPALRSLLQTSYPHSLKKPHDNFLSATTNTLRSHLIPSFHHISSTTTSANSTSTLSSFPHPRLSSLLLDQIAITCSDLGIHTTKYLQDIVPLVYSTLSNPFGPAHPPLLLAAVSVARAVVLNAHPRICRWRGEILGVVCTSWVYILEDEEQSKTKGEKGPELEKLKKELRGLVYLLKYALKNPVTPDEDQGQREAKEEIAGELQALVDADESLRECLLNEIDPENGEYFGLDS